MERLTIRRDHGITMAPGYDFGIDPDDYDLVQEILNRLAQYEDTGLEPEEVETMRESKADAQFMLTELCRHCDYDRLEELAHAEQEGRLVVLPCKVGEYVYIPNSEKNKVERVRVQGISISASGRTILKFGGYPFESAWGDGCGNDWFRTLEEAEAALEGGSHE